MSPIAVGSRPKVRGKYAGSAKSDGHANEILEGALFRVKKKTADVS